jgi:hypothetical protein
MSCILRVSGKALDIDALTSSLAIPAHRTWRIGEARSVVSVRVHADSGANFIVSNADFDAFTQQVEDATAFLQLNVLAIGKLASFPGVERVTLDFGVELLEESVASFSYLPPKLVALAAQARIGVEISHYACSQERGAEG